MDATDTSAESATAADRGGKWSSGRYPGLTSGQFAALTQVRAAARKKASLETRLAAATDELHGNIKSAMGMGVPAPPIMDVTDFSETRVYQIRGPRADLASTAVDPHLDSRGQVKANGSG